MNVDQNDNVDILSSLLVKWKRNLRQSVVECKIGTDKDLIDVQFTLRYGELVHLLQNVPISVERIHFSIDLDIVFRDRVGVLSGIIPLIIVDDQSSSFIDQMQKKRLDGVGLVIPEEMIHRFIMVNDYEGLFQILRQIIFKLEGTVNMRDVAGIVWNWGEGTRLNLALEYYHNRSLAFYQDNWRSNYLIYG